VLSQIIFSFTIKNLLPTQSGSSDLPIIGKKKRCSRKLVNKTEGPKFVPMKQSKGLRLHLTEY